MPEETNFPPEFPVSNPSPPPAPPVVPPAPPPSPALVVSEPTPGDNLETIMQEAPPQSKKSKGSFLKFLVFSLLVLLLASLVFGYYQYIEVQRLSELAFPPIPIPTLSLSPTPTPDPTIRWQLVTNSEHGYELRYPPELTHRVDVTNGDGYKIPYFREIFYRDKDQVLISVSKLIDPEELSEEDLTEKLKGASLILKDYREFEVDGQKAVAYKTENLFGQVEAAIVEIVAKQEGKRIYMRQIEKEDGYLDLMVSTLRFIDEKNCVDQKTGKGMTLLKAKQIASVSECTQEGELTDQSLCNQITGTWWLDLKIDKEGCAPACVIDVITEKAEINWRCTGLLQPEATATPTPCSTCGN